MLTSSGNVIHQVRWILKQLKQPTSEY